MNNKDFYYSNNHDTATHMRVLINKLNYYTELYDKGIPAISDKEWDNLYFELSELEKETGIIYTNSPTHKIHFNSVSELKKVRHEYQPMLSLDKTKDFEFIQSFVNGHDWLGMFKMDGLSCRLTYQNGELIKAETRGNGEIGEDIFHNALVIRTIPKIIPIKEEIIVDGEIICPLDIFNEFADTYKNPRNFAAGSIRLLNSEECASRNLSFIAWDLIKGSNEDFFMYRLEQLDHWGFTTVPRVGDAETVEDAINILDRMSEHKLYPIDGYVFRFESQKYYESLGRTAHHFSGAIAYKFYDEEYETTLKYIDYDVSRNGILTPVAVFEPIDIDGTTVSRASLHNLSVMEDIMGDCCYAGQHIWVIKSNQIIPQITKAIKKSYGEVVAAGGVSVDGFSSEILCPICGQATEIKTSESGIKFLCCSNDTCEGKLAQQIDHFCGKKGLDIKGISRKTIEKLIEWGWINGLVDIFKLEQYKTEWVSKEGFGAASVGKILLSIDAARSESKMENFISAIGIPLVGRTVAKEIVKYYPTWEEFRAAVGGDWTEFEGFGPEISKAINNFDYTEVDQIVEMLEFKQPEVQIKKQKAAPAIKDKTFCITGTLSSYKNRDELKAEIELLGGRVVNSVTSKVNYLINNNINSTSSKNKKAKELNIPIISEEKYIQLKNINRD